MFSNVDEEIANKNKEQEDIINDLNLPIKVIGLKKDSHHKTNTIIDQDLNEIKIDSVY